VKSWNVAPSMVMSLGTPPAELMRPSDLIWKPPPHETCGPKSPPLIVTFWIVSPVALEDVTPQMYGLAARKSSITTFRPARTFACADGVGSRKPM
jgi:hypothetical protein